MRGKIIAFDNDSSTGAIIGDDGARYDFVRLDWQAAAAPARGTAVEFAPDGPRALRIGSVRYDPREADTALAIYILYLASLFTGVTGLIGVIMAYINRSGAPEWVQTHYRFQIRTFWIGCLYGLISLVTAIVLVGFVFALFAYVWWIVRCAKGLKFQGRGEPYPAPASWAW